jgi:14-3-3 protein epsilon
MASVADAREDAIYRAKLFEQAEHYDGFLLFRLTYCILLSVLEMVNEMVSIARLKVDFTLEERNLFSVAFKNVIGAKRASWRIVSSVEAREEQKGKAEHHRIARHYRESIEKEIGEICTSVLELIDRYILPSVKTPEGTIFFMKMFPAHLNSFSIIFFFSFFQGKGIISAINASTSVLKPDEQLLGRRFLCTSME